MGGGLSPENILTSCVRNGAFVIKDGKILARKGWEGMVTSLDFVAVVKGKLSSGELTRFLQEHPGWEPRPAAASVAKVPPAGPTGSAHVVHPPTEVNWSLAADQPVVPAEMPAFKVALPPAAARGLFPGAVSEPREVGPGTSAAPAKPVAAASAAPPASVAMRALQAAVAGASPAPLPAPVPPPPRSPLATVPPPDRVKTGVLLQRLNPERSDPFQPIGQCWPCDMVYYAVLPLEFDWMRRCGKCHNILVGMNVPRPKPVAEPAGENQ